ncbi:MAG TPA: hypothetical protein VMS55_00925 [Myxococcota bacterium]|nr:hypothetical protein [Myxococcota bacterium]
MRHARDEDLDRIEPLLAKIRALGTLIERKRGIFYLRNRAFLHFHEDPAGMFADLRDGDDFARHRVGSAREQREFVRALQGALAEPAE